MALVRATSEMFHAGGYLVYGSLWDDSDPLVKAHPDWFSADFESEVQSSVHRTVPDIKGRDVGVESATAAPGEKRSTKS